MTSLGAVTLTSSLSDPTHSSNSANTCEIHQWSTASSCSAAWVSENLEEWMWMPYSRAVDRPHGQVDSRPEADQARASRAASTGCPGEPPQEGKVGLGAGQAGPGLPRPSISRGEMQVGGRGLRACRTAPHATHLLPVTWPRVPPPWGKSPLPLRAGFLGPSPARGSPTLPRLGMEAFHPPPPCPVLSF